MSKKLENIEIEVNEQKNASVPTWEVIIPGKKSVGMIEKDNDRYHAITAKYGYSIYSKTLESAINELLSYFTLHEK